MSAFDKDRYLRLRESAVFNMEAWRGTYQDQSKNALAMTAVGTPSWTSINGLPALSDCVNMVGAASAATGAIVDVTTAFSVEVCGIAAIAGNPFWIRHRLGGGGGGFGLFCGITSANGYFGLILYTAAGAAARTNYIPSPALQTLHTSQLFHLIVVSTGGGTGIIGSVNGVNRSVLLTGAGVAANTGATAVQLGGAGGSSTGSTTILLVRAYPFALTNADVATLYASAKLLTGGEV